MSTSWASRAAWKPPRHRKAARFSGDRAVVDIPAEGGADRQPRHGRVRVHDLGGAQADRPDAAAVRSESGGPVRPPAADRRPREADPEGGLRTGLGNRP